MHNLNTLGVIGKVQKQKCANQIVVMLMLFLNQIIQTIQSGQREPRTLSVDLS